MSYIEPLPGVNTEKMPSEELYLASLDVSALVGLNITMYIDDLVSRVCREVIIIPETNEVN